MAAHARTYTKTWSSSSFRNILRSSSKYLRKQCTTQCKRLADEGPQASLRDSMTTTLPVELFKMRAHVTRARRRALSPRKVWQSGSHHGKQKPFGHYFRKGTGESRNCTIICCCLWSDGSARKPGQTPTSRLLNSGVREALACIARTIGFKSNQAVSCSVWLQMLFSPCASDGKTTWSARGSVLSTA